MIKNSLPDKKNHKELFDKDYNQAMERFNKLDLKSKQKISNKISFKINSDNII